MLYIGMENQHNSNVFFYKLALNCIPSSVQIGWLYIYNVCFIVILDLQNICKVYIDWQNICMVYTDFQ